ncbi:MAG: putative acetylglutamate kinase-like protein [Phycisphaerales bacterium]|nr:MAG: putative acetylglutamate kinase-like protein [Phycisphaerales bacterium]
MIVVKIGGGKGIDPRPACEDVAGLVADGQRVVLVHGASQEASELSLALGVRPRFITSPSGHTSRYTDAQAMDVFHMACRRRNGRIVALLRSLGVDAVGLSGMDGGLWMGRRKPAIRAEEGGVVRIIRDDMSGRVERVDARLLEAMLDLGKTPVLCPPAISDRHEPINVDADRAAAATASALGAGVLVILSNVPGLLRRYPDPRTRIARILRGEVDRALSLAQGPMKRKVLAAAEALDAGVERVVLSDARREEPIVHALEGEGTVLACG